ncbi:protein SMAX1-LIKE 3-like [Phragmites australis]|uniref:protein SMAX1-LIKE 3-like n=1 Tax=Phragmites australis TaxID=29695 RepID=UPI002D766337|nr:protein SMAX1-LIKE 3-like [Phragmites australis]
MRSGGCAVQQALAAEAAAVVRQAVALARRRGHAQVTPLHVASAMLSAAGLLRAACLRSHSHPLQCKALELCFNVALNRLPTAGPAVAMFHHHVSGHGHHAPVLSNALVAAFKRAQAHQRRGAVEGQPQQQPQPVLAAKVELEQLIISILDDPSVSRVMREAGFSSPQVKANVEKAVASPEHHPNTATSHAMSSPSSGHARRPNATAEDDAMRVLDCMASGSKRCVIVVGESATTAEGVVKAVMDKVSKGELQHRHERLKNLQFVPLSAASFQRKPREEVEAKASDLRALVRQGCAAGKGVVLVLEDLSYSAEAWAAASERRRRGVRDYEHGQCYCPVEHAVMEVSSLVSAGGGGRSLDRFWLLGFGNNQAYMKCRAGQPSLEAVWELHPVVVPADSDLALSLSCASEAQQASQEISRTGWPFVNVAAAESEITAMPSLPPWLRRYQDPEQTRQESCSTSLQLQDWNPNCNGSAAHHTSELTLSFSSPAITSPAASISGFAHSYNYNTDLMMSSKPWQFKPMQHWPSHRHDEHQPLHANPSPESYSVSNSSDGGSTERPKFTELTAENLKILCTTLENQVPRHKDVVADVASAVLHCRSGMTRRMRWHQEKPNAATWLLFNGRDSDSKKAVAQELARLVFGSYNDLTSISLDEFTPIHSGELILKRQRSPDNGHGYVQGLYEAILENPHRVIMIDGVEQLVNDSEISIRNAIANGRIRGCSGHEISLEDAIVVLSCEALDSRSSASSPRLKQRFIDNGSEEGNCMNIEKGMGSSCFTLDLNACAEDGDADEESILDNVRITDIVDGAFLFQLKEDL